MNVSFRIPILFLITLIPACFWNQDDSSRTLNLFFSQSRHLELEPCGCSLGPKGGIVREFNFLRSARSHFKTASFYFLMGPTFAPDEGTNFHKSQKNDRVRAEALAKAFKINQVNFIGASAEDTIWEESYLQQLAQEGGFKWISANLFSTREQKPLFSQFDWITLNQQNILITSLSAPASPFLQKQMSGLIVKEPETSLKELLSRLEQKPNLVLILTNLERETRLNIARSVPVPVLFLGSKEEVITDSVEQVSSSAVLATVSQRAKGILRTQIQLIPNGTQFFGEKFALQTEYTRSVYESALASNEKLLQKEKSLPLKQSLEAENKKRRETLEILKNIPLKPNSQTFHFRDSETTLLGPEWDLPTNILSPIVEESKKGETEKPESQ